MACALAAACAVAPAQDLASELTPERRARLQWEAGYVLHQLGEYERAVEAYTVLQRSVNIHPTVSELIPTILGELKPMD